MDLSSCFNTPGPPWPDGVPPHQLPPNSYQNRISADASHPHNPSAPVDGHGLPLVPLPPSPYRDRTPANPTQLFHPPVPPSSNGLPVGSLLPTPYRDRTTPSASQQLPLTWPRSGNGEPVDSLTLNAHQDHDLLGASQHLHSAWPANGTPVDPWMTDQYQIHVYTDPLRQYDLSWSFGENGAPLNPLPRDPVQAHVRTDFEYLHQHLEAQGHDSVPQYPVVGKRYASNTSANYNHSTETGEGPPIGFDDSIFDYFDRVQNASGPSACSPATSPDPDLRSGSGKIYNFAEPSGIAPAAQMQTPGIETDQVPEPPSNAAAPTIVPQGKLVFLELDDGKPGKCESVSGEGNKCDRAAPKFGVVNGHGERVCMCLSKHLPQWRRAHALPPSFKIIPKTLAQAKKEVYPSHTPFHPSLILEDASLITEQDQQMKWQTRFVEAALAVYDGDNEKLRDQQTCFNGNVECDDDDNQYSDDQVNARMALLFHIAYNTHVGGERLYAIHGDNAGYTKERRRLTFLQRLEAIEQSLRINKRIVMDVIQGRGVLALVDTPLAYNNRKSTNNTNNETKKRARPEDGEGDSQGGNNGASGRSASPASKQRKPVKKVTPRAKKGGKGKEKAQEAALPVKQDPSAPGGESKIAQHAVLGAPPGLTSGEPSRAGHSHSGSTEDISQLAPTAGEPSSLLHGNDRIFSSPDWEKCANDPDRSWKDSSPESWPRLN